MVHSLFALVDQTQKVCSGLGQTHFPLVPHFLFIGPPPYLLGFGFSPSNQLVFVLKTSTLVHSMTTNLIMDCQQICAIGTHNHYAQCHHSRNSNLFLSEIRGKITILMFSSPSPPPNLMLQLVGRNIVCVRVCMLILCRLQIQFACEWHIFKSADKVNPCCCIGGQALSIRFRKSIKIHPINCEYSASENSE